MPEQPTVPPVNDGGNGDSDNRSLLTKGMARQASPDAHKPAPLQKIVCQSYKQPDTGGPGSFAMEGGPGVGKGATPCWVMA